MVTSAVKLPLDAVVQDQRQNDEGKPAARPGRYLRRQLGNGIVAVKTQSAASGLSKVRRISRPSHRASYGIGQPDMLPDVSWALAQNQRRARTWGNSASQPGEEGAFRERDNADTTQREPK